MLNHIRECGMGSRTGTLTDGEVERVIDGLMVQQPPARRVLLVPPYQMLFLCGIYYGQSVPAFVRFCPGGDYACGGNAPAHEPGGTD